MKKSIKMLILFIMFFICFSILNCVDASGFIFLIDPTDVTIKQGDSVTFDLRVSNIDVGLLGINTVEAILDYDENVFESVYQTSFLGQNNWSITYNSEEGINKGKFLAVILESGVTDDQTIGKLTLKVREDIPDTTTVVNIKEIKTNDGINKISTSDQVVNLNISATGEIVDSIESTVSAEGEKANENIYLSYSLPYQGAITAVIIIILALIIVIVCYKISKRKNK